MSYDRPPPGIFTPGDASPKTKWIMLVGVLVAVVGGIRDKDWMMLKVGCGIVLAGGLFDLFQRRGNRSLIYIIAGLLILGTIGEISHPKLMAEWMGQFGNHANAFLKGGK